MPTEIQEALTALGAQALVPKIIDPKVLEVVRRYSPLMTMLPSTPWDSTVYYFNRRTKLPVGGAVGDGGARPVASSTYEQRATNIALYQSVGSVTGYAQATTRMLIGDLLRREQDGAVKALTYGIETDMCWGNNAATDGTWPQMDGLDTLFSAFTATGSVKQNSLDAGGAELTLGYLDQLIDLVEQNNSARIIGDDWAFVLSPRAGSSFAQALIPQSRGDWSKVEIAPGLYVDAYRGVPLVLSSFLSARAQQMGAVTTATGTGGSLPATERFYKVSAVLGAWGEIAASAEVNATPAASGTVTLSFTPPTGYDGFSVNSYRVYESGTTGTETLLGIVDAVVGFQADGITPIPTTSIEDTGTALIPKNGATVPPVLPTAYFATNSGMLPRVPVATPGSDLGGEDVYLISRDPDNLIRPYVRPMQPVPVAATVTAPDTLPFAMVTDTAIAVRAPEFGARLRNVVAALSNTNPVINMRTVS